MRLSTLSAVVLFAALATPALAAPTLNAFDVAEDHTRFVFAPNPVHENGMPAYGNPFVTQGYIYPVGTLTEGVDGVLKDGSATFPEKVLGTWTCDGWFVADGGNTKTGTWLISRQTYEFKDGDVLITQGPEIADESKTSARAITGGTGEYAQLDGVMMQTLLGFTENMGAEVRFELQGATKVETGSGVPAN